MEIREQHNLARLLVESFALLNRCGGALFGLIIAIILVFAVQAVLLWIGTPYLLIKLMNFFISAYFGVVLLRIFCAKAENTDESVSNSLSAAVIPAFYQIIFNIFYGVILIICFLPGFFLFKNKLSEITMMFVTQSFPAGNVLSLVFILLAAAALPLYAVVRLMYAPLVIATRDQGPVQAVLYSVQLTSGKMFFTAAGALLVTFVLPLAYVGGVLYGGYTMIPLYFADSFNLAQLSPVWIGVFIAVGIAYLAILLAMPAFLVLVFLNQDYGHNRDSFTPQAELKLTSQETQVFGADNNILPPGVGNIVRPKDVAGVAVVKSSVKASAEDGVTEQHLQQVYQPKPEDLVQYADEEDRMPTILFDDDMARQIEQERNMWEHKQQQDKTKKGEDDAPSVKMSK